MTSDTIFREYRISDAERSDRSAGDRLRHREKVRESIRENRAMFWSIVGVAGIAFACSIEFVPELNEKLKLVKFTSEFQWVLTSVMVVDYAGCWLVEQGLKWAFSDDKPKEIATRNRKSEKKTV